MEQPDLFLRIDFARGSRLGPGKIALLEAIELHGSISAAARNLGMGYRTAWLLVESLNTMFLDPVTSTLPGRREKATCLTDFGRALIASFRRMEQSTREATRTEVAALEGKLR